MTNPLPPLGFIGPDDHAAVGSAIQLLAYEAYEARAAWIPLADSNVTVYTYGDDPAPADPDLILIHEIQNAVLSIVEIQTKDPLGITLEPVETGEPGEIYWAGPPTIGMRLMLAPEQLAPSFDPTTGQEFPPQPIPQDQADAMGLEDLVAAKAIKPDWVVTVNDDLVSEVYQSIFNVFWSRSQADLFIRRNLMTTNITGWSFSWYEWNVQRQAHLMRILSVRQVYIDPTVEDIDDAAYAGVDLVLDASEAKMLYPHLEAEIDAFAVSGVPPRFEATSEFGVAFNRNFHRPMIVIRVFWLRNQPCAYQPEDAIQRGLVEQREVPVESGDALPDANAQPQVGGPIREDSGPNLQADAAGEVSGGPAADATVPPENLGLPRPTRQSLFLPGSQEGVAPSIHDEATGRVTPHPQWPTYLCLRQITIIGSQIVDDRECEHFDIPLLHNVNRPIPFTPWGIGEPQFLRSPQKARNRMLNAAVKHTEFLGSPACAMPESMAAALEADYGSAYVDPGTVLRVPDDLWTLHGGKIDVFYSPPPLPPAIMDMQNALKAEISEQSGHTDVIQGRTEPGVKAAAAIGMLQEASTGVASFKSKRTEDLVHRLAMLMLHSIVWKIEADDLLEICSKYPKHIFEAIHRRARQMEWDINVMVTSGAGQAKERKGQQARLDYQMGLITLETARERIGIDHRQETQREEARASKMAQMGMQPSRQGSAPGRSQKPSNGKPRPSSPAGGSGADGNGNGHSRFGGM